MVVTREILNEALSNPLWANHQIGDLYRMEGEKGKHWKIAYYPIFEDYHGEPYGEPRALVETKAIFQGKEGIDFREVPLRYLTKV
jgi:hypothetical protein